jgi:hypothetical protein
MFAVASVRTGGSYLDRKCPVAEGSGAGPHARQAGALARVRAHALPEGKCRALAFWGTLALMRCVGSSPAAALSALRNRLAADPDRLEEQVFDDEPQHFPPLAPRAPARESRPEIKGRGRRTRSSVGRSSG